MYLPGTVNERIGDLRTSKGLQQKELAAMIGVSASQLSRIENGETTNINADTIAKLARALNVSTDYILGLTTVSVPKSYDISELGLSESAVKNLLIIKSYGATPVLNHLLGHKRFPTLITHIKAYFYDEVAMGIIGINEMFELATTSLEDLRKMQPEKSADIRSGQRLINAEKSNPHEADIEKIKNAFMAIQRDIKKEIGNSDEPMVDTAPLDLLRQMQAELRESMSEAITEEQAASILTEKLAHTGIFNEETMEMFKTIAQSAFEKMSGETRGITNGFDKSDSNT